MDSTSSKRGSDHPWSSSKSSGLRRSHSVKNSSHPSSSTSGASSLPRSSALRALPSSSSGVGIEKGSGNVARKYSSMAKEQKARFYIMRRCVAMLVCWHKHGDRSVIKHPLLPLPRPKNVYHILFVPVHHFGF
ncbi:hypothetical protein MLD38_017362 [Melastoma candidum]|uniref:Uncharacterized protein n=1 Tax=Melastoma candidum TaxID=119954 RepID=A0ACB9QTW8_9MYRT|nr:hypothetical protein MLD38_017362 [Melastoma candidum]